MATDVELWENQLYGMGLWLYTLWVDGEEKTQFTSRKPLTWSQQLDVVSGFREAYAEEEF